MLGAPPGTLIIAADFDRRQRARHCPLVPAALKAV